MELNRHHAIRGGWLEASVWKRLAGRVGRHGVFGRKMPQAIKTAPRQSLIL
jgi:hypothetical protein